MNELTSVGIILLLALVAGHLVKFLRVPEVTGYLAAGIALGPSATGWISPDNLATLEILSEVALGLILFSIGTVFEFDRFRRMGSQVVWIVASESMIVAAMVGAALAWLGQPWPVALLLACIAIETAAASTLMVLREYNAKGPMTDVLVGVFALDNLVCLVAFGSAVAAIQLATQTDSSVFRALFPLFWQLFGSVAVGYVIGFVLSMWSPKVVEHGEQLILLAGCVLLGVGAAKALGLSAMITNLAIGATLVNLSEHSRRLFASLSQTDPPLYAIFFVLAGAELDLSLLTSIGAAGAAYVGARAIGKLTGASVGSRMAKLDRAVGSHLRWTMFSQAGLAVGLTLGLSRQLPDLAPSVTAIVLSAVIVFEAFGPLSVRRAVVRGGEAHAESEPSVALVE